MNQEKTVGGFHFVPLEMTDEMPTNRGTCRCHFAQRLLDAVFTDIFEARIPGRRNCIRPVSLCYGDDPNLLAMPSTPGGFADPLPNLGETVRQVLKWHNAPSYQGLQIESREAPRPLFRALSSSCAGHCSSLAKYSPTGSMEGRNVPTDRAPICFTHRPVRTSSTEILTTVS
jgi:hypothetical protein